MEIKKSLSTRHDLPSLLSCHAASQWSRVTPVFDESCGCIYRVCCDRVRLTQERKVDEGRGEKGVRGR